MLDHEVVSSSPEEEFGFRGTCSPVPGPHADGPLPCAPYGHTQLSGQDPNGAHLITTQSFDSCDGGALRVTEDGVFSARGVDQMAPLAKAPAPLNWQKRVRRRIQKGCRWVAALFCFYPSPVEE